MSDRRNVVFSYAAAIGAVAIATLVRVSLSPWIGDQLPFITYFAAVAVATWRGGLWPGVFATVLSYLAAAWFFLPGFGVSARPGSGAERILGLLAFLATSAILIALQELLHRANRRVGIDAAELGRQRNMLAVTLSSIGDGVIATDVEGRVTFLNPTAEKLTGYSQAEARGLKLPEVFHIVNERTRVPVENLCERVLRTGATVGLANHTVLIAKNGPETPIDDSAAPIFDGAGAIVGTVIVFHDASEARAARATREYLAAIVEHSEDAMVSKNRDGVITSWNKAAERLLGYTAEEAVGKHISLIVPEEKREELQRIMQRLWGGERIEHWDTTRRRKDGTLVQVSLQISPIRNGEGEVIGAAKVARDITERKRSERALEVLAETSRVLSALVDRKSTMQHAASLAASFFAEWCAVFTVEEGKIIRQACAHSDPDKHASLQETLEKLPIDWESPAISVQVMRTGDPKLINNPHAELAGHDRRTAEERRAAAAFAPRSVISAPLLIRGRTVGAMTFVHSDPSRTFSQFDVNFAMDFSRRVATALDNAEMYHSLQEAARQKDEFLAMLAHELRNPLAAIKYATAVARMPVAEGHADMLDMMDRQGDNLSRLVDDLLDVSRISRDKIQLKKEKIETAVLAQRAVATVRPLMEQKKHSFSVSLTEEPAPLFVDATRVEQIIANLLTNAAKYTPEGGNISLGVSLDNGEAVLRVKDSGVGIPPEMLPHVFELFTQADRSLDRSEGGLGIGLTVARKLAEMHGGTVTAASEGLGHGAEFTLRLPLTENSDAPEVGRPAVKANSVKSLKILVVDDNVDTARAETLLLRAAGHEVRTAHDGKTALNEARAFRPDAILLDIGLPGMNGFQVAQALREEGFTRETLVAISGYGQPEDRQKSREAGFDHHLIKPVEHAALMEILGRVKGAGPELTARD